MSPGRRFVPASDEDRAKARTIPVGVVCPVDIRVPRNYKHHAKFRALVSFVAGHHPRFRTEADVMLELKLRTGHYTEHIRASTGEVIFVPLPTNFSEMDEGEFVAWSAKAKQVIVSELLPEFRPADIQRLERELDEWSDWCMQ